MKIQLFFLGLALAGMRASPASELLISSFDRGGRLTFLEVTDWQKVETIIREHDSAT